MTPKSIFNAIQNGNTVVYSVVVLRGHLYGGKSLAFTPNMRRLSVSDIGKRLKNFRHDESPYWRPSWVVTNATGTILLASGYGGDRAVIHRRVKTPTTGGCRIHRKIHR